MKEQSSAHAYLASLSAGSQRAMTQALATLARLATGDDDADPFEFDWISLDGDKALHLKRALTEQYAPATTNKMLAAMRGVMRAARDQGVIDEAHYQQIARVRSVKVVPADDLPTLTQSQIRKLFAATAEDSKAAGRRDAAVLAAFLATGLRRAEAAELNLEHLDLEAGTIRLVGETPDRVRTSPLDAGAIEAMADWVHVRSTDPGPLILPTVRGGALQMRRLTDQSIYLLIRQIGEKAGMPDLNSRILRRTMIVRAIAAGADREALTSRVGHMSWLNAMAFDDLAKLAKRRKVTAQPLPYVSPKGATR